VRLEWTATAKRDLKDIIDYIWLDNPQAARRMNTRFRAVARLLAHSPDSGKLGAITGTREFVAHSNYREAVSIMALVHTSRQWPPVEPEGDH
jgi:toxin ParE1/3/4